MTIEALSSITQKSFHSYLKLFLLVYSSSFRAKLYSSNNLNFSSKGINFDSS